MLKRISDIYISITGSVQHNIIKLKAHFVYQVGYTKLSFDQLGRWNSTNYNGENVTFNYEMVQNLDEVNNISYPVLITIAASTLVSQNKTVQCHFTVGPSSANFSFRIDGQTPLVILMCMDNSLEYQHLVLLLRIFKQLCSTDNAIV
jgi:hypothetical protein